MRAAPPPVLDRRDDDQILEQLRKLAARLVPEWKGDPDAKPDAGTMLHRIFTTADGDNARAPQQGART